MGRVSVLKIRLPLGALMRVILTVQIFRNFASIELELRDLKT